MHKYNDKHLYQTPNQIPHCRAKYQQQVRVALTSVANVDQSNQGKNDADIAPRQEEAQWLSRSSKEMH